MRTFFESIVVAVACLALCSCSSSNRAVLEGVTGKVTVDGTAVAGVKVAACSPDPKKQIPVVPQATTAEDGSFQLASGSWGKGVLAGEYVLLFSWEEGGRDKLNGRYAPGKSTVTVTVGDSAVDVGTIALTTQ